MTDEAPEVSGRVIAGDVHAMGTVSAIHIENLVREISQIDPSEIQQVAASQIRLLTAFYDTVLAQAQQSFRWALIGVGVGLSFFIVAIAFLLFSNTGQVATISAIAGGLVEVIAGINFVLYGKAAGQLGSFHERLEQTQRILLANSITESIEGDARNSTRSQLVMEVVRSPGSAKSSEIDS
jgi:hypothetical protein